MQRANVLLHLLTLLMKASRAASQATEPMHYDLLMQQNIFKQC